MGHQSARKNYEELVARLNKFPQGAPPTETLYKILAILFSEEEAKFVSKIPIQAFNVQKAAQRTGLSIEKCKEICENLAARALLVDVWKQGEHYYILPPPMAGWIEFSMMRIRDDIDQHSLGQLLHQYMNVEEDFVRELFFGSDTKMVRTFVNETALDSDQVLSILDFEKASHIITSAEHIGVGVCYCRHKMEHVDKNCDAPMEICMTFNGVADSLIRANYARRIDVEECLTLLEKAYAHNLVQIGENVQNKVAFICNCCGCCCEAILAAKKFGTSATIATTTFYPKFDLEQCISCNQCIEVCPVDALSWQDDGTLSLDEEMCLGCGVCVRNCPTSALVMEKSEQRLITPVNSAHRVVLTAIDKGMLANLIFDNDSLASHRVLAAILKAIVSLPPAKQLLANQQIRSKYVARLVSKV